MLDESSTVAVARAGLIPTPTVIAWRLPNLYTMNHPGLTESQSVVLLALITGFAVFRA